MTTTMFKGARYIVKFHDPIAWASTESYEAIEAVQYQAYTYISKQPVPAGVDISNSDFWLLWADPNAQMEQLRQLVQSYVEDFDELEIAVGNIGDALATETQNRENADAAIKALLPDTEFSDENTVKDALDTIEGEIAALDTRVTKIEFDGISYKQGVEERYIWNIIEFDKSKFIANYALTTGNGNTSSALVDYVRREKPFFCCNVTNSESFVFNGISYGEAYAPPSRASWYVKDNLEDDFTVIRCNGVDTQNTIADLGYKYVGGGWQGLIVNGQLWTIDEYETFHMYMPYQLFAWDDDKYYIAQLYGRMNTKPGLLMSEAQAFALSQGWLNCVALDSGDSMREFFGKSAPVSISHRFNATNYDRPCYYNLTISERA